MEQKFLSYQSKLNDTENDVNENDEKIEDENNDCTVCHPEDGCFHNETLDNPVYDDEENTSESDGDNVSDISRNTNRDASSSKRSNSDYCTSSDDDHSPNSNRKYPKKSEEKYGENRWSSHERRFNCFIRNQSRLTNNMDFTELKSSLTNVILNGSQFCSHKDKKLWYRATSWKSARKILKWGPNFRDKRQDLASHGAFYLNPDYDDCYEWLRKKNGVFQGKHAILVFVFDPWSVDKHGETLNVDEWKKVVHKRNSEKSPFNWSLAPQNKDPSNKNRKEKNVQFRYTADGEIAQQLVIRSKAMCPKLSDYLVGCIFFEKTESSSNSTHSRLETQSNSRGGKQRQRRK